MNPAGTIPATLEEARSTSLMAYLERYGGYGQSRDLGLVMWAVAHIYDHAARGNLQAVQDHTAMLAVMLEQAALDGGQWQVAWLLGLLEDPPQNLWLNRNSAATGGRKPFGALCSQTWATTALAVIKENEILFTKRAEATGAKGSQPEAKANPSPNPKAKPKRRPAANNASGSAPQTQQTQQDQQG
eukprot:s3074_g10.t1